MKENFNRISKLSLLLVGALVLSGCTVQCRDSDLRVAKIRKVKPEASYSFTALNNHYFTKDGETSSIKAMVNELSDDTCKSISNEKLIGNTFYFTAWFDDENLYLYSLNVETQNVKLLYSFTNAYPQHAEDFKEGDERYPFLMQYYKDSHIFFEYGQSLYSFSLAKEKMAYSVAIEETPENGKFNDYGDYSILTADDSNDMLYYYELMGKAFTLHEYQVHSDSKYVHRWGNYVYTTDDTLPNTYPTKYPRNIVNAFDLTAKQGVEPSALISKMEEAEAQAEIPPYSINGKGYYIETEGRSIKVLDADKTEISLADVTQNEAFIALEDLWTENHNEYGCSGFWCINDKLFVGYNATYSWALTTPTYIYEYDIENATVRYIGFSFDVPKYLFFHD